MILMLKVYPVPPYGTAVTGVTGVVFASLSLFSKKFLNVQKAIMNSSQVD